MSELVAEASHGIGMQPKCVYHKYTYLSDMYRRSKIDDVRETVD